MNDLSAKEKFANFMSYLKLFAFLIVAGGGGYYYYTHLSHKKPVEATAETISNPMSDVASVPPIVVDAQKPSELMSPVMEDNLPLLWDDFSTTPVVLKPDFIALENAVNEQQAKSDKMQPAWKMAHQVCQQMRAICVERNAAATALARLQKPDRPLSSVKISQIQIQEEARKQEFFTRSAEQHWKSSVPLRKKKIEALYRQLLSAEAGN